MVEARVIVMRMRMRIGTGREGVFRVDRWVGGGCQVTSNHGDGGAVQSIGGNRPPRSAAPHGQTAEILGERGPP